MTNTVMLDEIGHNPYELASYLTVVFEDYTREEVQATLQQLFEQQYELILEEEVEIEQEQKPEPALERTLTRKPERLGKKNMNMRWKSNMNIIFSMSPCEIMVWVM